MTICISIAIYCSIRTAKDAKTYEPPEGSSNAAEKIERMKRFQNLVVRVLLLNSAFTLFYFLSYLFSFIEPLCLLANDSDFFK